MKANELMIGDWVNVTAAENIVRPDVFSLLPKKGKIVGIDGDCIYVDFVEHPFMFGDIEPIPLTPEILKKNGFKDCQYYAELLYGEWQILCDCAHLAMRNSAGWSVDIPCGFIHDLQHALRLCGIEKEVVL
ncbi:hypothetical protein [Selenomonas ruminantium]|uniref:hypothetical protein n=1 Tax=Selenomonas ruminantium TaxID=971 RepID=UPI0026F16CE1|nr:hypothetical protein [Selenomonas ruminantium]